MKTTRTRLLVLGGGPGGYVAAIRAGQLGIPTVLVESDHLGGTCLNVGCIPSKALIHVADEYAKAMGYAAGSSFGLRVERPSVDMAQLQGWKTSVVSRLTGGVGALLAKAGVQVVRGWATLQDGKSVEVVRDGAPAERIECEQLLLATGSVPVELPGLPFGGRVISSTQALALSEVPRRLVVVGGGYIGLELGIAWRKLGAEVTVAEASDGLLPGYDRELVRPVQTRLRQLGVDVRLQTRATGLADDGAGVVLRHDAGAQEVLAADRVLVAAGRRPRMAGFGLEGLRLAMNGPAVRIDDRCQTSMRGVWAIGDLTGEPMLAHRAMAQGEMVAEILAGRKRRFAPASIPAVCFTDPEIVSVGQSPEGARLPGQEVIAASFPFAANGRALSLDSPQGFVRVVALQESHRIVGWQAVGPGVSELASAFAQSLEMGARLEDVGGTMHAHPTLGEAVQEAALRCLGHALHI